MAIYNTEGIVLQKIDYSETSLILKVLTQEKGLQSFIFQGAKRKNKKGQLVSPLAILNITYFQRKESDLSKISAIELAQILNDIPVNPIKSSILFFINEVLQKTIKEEEVNAELYSFLRHSIEILDAMNSYSHFPIKFLLELLKHLGYYPIIEKDATYFDYLNGKLTKHQPSHPNYMEGENMAYLKLLFEVDYTNEDLKIPYPNRQIILSNILEYYKMVISDFKSLKSIDVLESIMH